MILAWFSDWRESIYHPWNQASGPLQIDVAKDLSQAGAGTRQTMVPQGANRPYCLSGSLLWRAVGIDCGSTA